MALERGGIELIVKNFGSFISRMGQVNKSYQSMGKAADGYAKSTQKASNTVLSAQRRLETAQRNLHKALLADSVAWRKAKIAREELAKAQDKVNFQKAIHDIAQTEKSLAKLTAAEYEEAKAKEKSAIANTQYQSTLESMRNAKTRVASATEALMQAHLAENAAMTKASSLAATAGIAMKVLGVAVAALGIALGAAALAWKGFTKAVDLAIAVLNKIWGVIKSVASSIGRFFSNVLSTAAGFGLYDIFRNIGSAISDTVSEVIDAIGFFQRLEIQLEALAARDIAQEFGIPMADAFQRAGLQAKELDTWIKNLAVRTPFTARSIAETLAMSNAMGLNVGMSKKMTKATIDFTSAMGLTEDHMFRIIYNFGQMLAQGKLNGREFRDLANSFVPVWRMMENMAEAAGMDTEAFKKLAFEGGVPVEAFFAEFVRMAETDFAGAGEKMARTLTGVANNFKDFIQIIVGTSILGPVMDRIAEKLANMLDQLLTPEIRAGAERLGQVLLTTFQMVERGVDDFSSALGGLAKALGLPIPSGNTLYNMFAGLGIVIRRALVYATEFINGLTTRFSAGLDGLGSKMASWGYNLVASFASGMASAINLIVMVINAISRILSSWFKGSSPPKIAKNIDKWGADMIAEWVKGWTKFDISAFSDIADTVESFLRSIAYKIGGKDNINLIPRILGSRKVIADAINAVRNGLISVGDAAERVFDQVGNLTDEFKNFITALFDVEAAQKKVADAAKAVEEAEKKVAEAQKKVADAEVYVENANDRIKRSQEELTKVTEHYESVLKDLNDQLRAVTEEYDEQRRLSQINQAIGSGLLTDAEKERLAMEKRSIELKQQIRNVEEERDAATNAIEERIKAYELEREAAQARVDALEEQVDAMEEYVDQLREAEEAAQDELDAAQERLDLTKAIIDEQIKQNELVQEQIELLKQLAEAAKDAGGGGGGGGIEDLTDLFEGLGGAIDEADGKLRAFRGRDKEWNVFPPSVPQIFNDVEKAIDGFTKSLGGIAPALAPLIGEDGAIGKLTGAFAGLFSIFTPENLGAMQTVNQMPTPIQELATAAGNLGKAVADYYIQLLGFFTTLASVAGLTDDGSLVGLIETITKAVEWATTLVGWAILVIDTVSGMKQTIYDKLSAAQADVETFVYGVLYLLGVLKLGAVGNSIIPEMMQAIYDEMTGKFDEIIAYIGETWVVQTLASLVGWALLVVGPGGVIPTAMEGIWTAITTKMDETKTEWDTRWTAFKTSVDDMWNGGDGIIAKIDAAIKAVAAFFGLDGTLGTAISNFINSIIVWATEQIGLLADALLGLKQQWDAIKGILGIELQSGGPALKGGSYIVGEAGREMFVPAESGFVIPNWMTERLLAPQMASGATSNTYITNVEVNPSYKNVQSEASLYYDVSAALAASRR